MRRPATVVAVLCVLALASAACTGGGGRTAPQPTATGGGEIVVASGLDVTGSDGVRQQLIRQWNLTDEGKRHPARLVELPGTADQQRSQLLGALQSGSSSYDVVNLDVTWVPEFAQAGLISPLDHQLDLDDGDVIASVAGTGVWKGHTYAAPFNSDVGLLYYRVDSLREAGVDPSSYPGAGGSASSADTGGSGASGASGASGSSGDSGDSGTSGDAGADWRQVQSLIRDVEAAPASDRPGAYEKGWTSQLDAYEGLTVNAIEAFASAGVQLTDAEGHYTANASKLRTGLEALRARADTDYTLPDALTSREPQSLSDFAAGRTVFLRHWPYAYGALSQTLDTTKLHVAALPGKAVLGGQNLAVAAGSPRSRYALDLIAYLTKPESERCLLDAGFAATRKSAYTKAKVRCQITAAASGTGSSGAGPGPSSSAEAHGMPRDGDGRPAYAFPILLPALADAVQRPRTPYYGAFTQLLQSHLHDWLTDPNSMDLDRLSESLDKALAKVLKGK